MVLAFNKILIPVDFSIGTEIAVKKAIGLIGHENAEIYLMHIAKPRVGAAAKYKLWQAEQKLDQWRSVIEETLDGIKVKTAILRGASIGKLIIESANMLLPDLIIIGKQDKRRYWPFSRRISPDQIAKKSNCPVLTAKPGSIYNKTKIIVLPVSHFVPERKLELAILIAKKCKAQVHLLMIRETKKGVDADLSPSFLKTYHHLRQQLHHPVEYYPISGDNLARKTLQYAESVMADMILVNPETESGIHTLTGSRHISDLIAKNSKIQVLDVQPY